MENKNNNKIIDLEQINQNKVKMLTPEQVEAIREKLKNKGQIDNNVITLKSCIEIVDNFISGEATLQQLEDFGNKMSIRAYVPIMEKMATLMKVLMKHEVSAVESTEIRMTELYKDIFFTVVLGLYGQVQFDEYDKEDRKLLTYENYDKLFPLFNQFILTYCREDYEVFMSMLKDCISFNGIVRLSEGLESLDGSKIEDTVKANKELVNSLKESKELVENIKDVMMMTDKTTGAVVKQIKDMTMSEVMEKAKENEERKRMITDTNSENDN